MPASDGVHLQQVMLCLAIVITMVLFVVLILNFIYHIMFVRTWGLNSKLPACTSADGGHLTGI